MKIRTIMTAAATGILLTAAGSSLAWGAGRTCPRGYARCTDYEYCRSHEHGDCEGRWSEDGDWICPDGKTMDRRPHQALQGMDAMAETALMADAAAVHITDRKTVLHLAVPDIWSGYSAGIRCRRP